MSLRDIMSKNSLSRHQHDTGLVRGEINCDACDDRRYSDSFVCFECSFSVHRKCTFLFGIRDGEKHLSHDGHCLQLVTTGAPPGTDPKCHICGKNTKRLLYHCSTCNLNLDIDCITKDLSARALEMPWHHHPLVQLGYGHQMRCEVCGDSGGSSYDSGGSSYFCPTCKLMVHESCIAVFFDSPEISHPFHVRHSLKLLTKGAPDYTDSKCHVCGKLIENFLYHCDICKFNLDMTCAIEDHQQHTVTPVVLSNLKIHEYTITLTPRLVTFICDACGTKGDRSPYVYHQGCDNMYFHQKCAHLPRVIHVNRHDHRVSYKYPLGRGAWTCEICLEDIDWSYGAFTCSICPNYALHSTCAIRKDVWDGMELDGVPEEVLDIQPFKLNDDNTITHFAHEQHKMRLNKDGIALEESILCEGCVRPIASNTFYKCLVCSFVLHETCANLPKTKRHFLSSRPLRLQLINGDDRETCNACGQYCCSGFVYTNKDDGSTFDVICCSITLPFIHETHEHPLLYFNEEQVGQQNCQNCGIKSSKIGKFIGCIKCNYYLDFACITLPTTVSVHKYDGHPLTLCYGEEANGKYWCDICERRVNPKQWFYTCNDCCVTLHIFCLLGDRFRYAKPGATAIGKTKLIFNNTSSRPTCCICDCRSVAPYYIIWEGETFCSAYCILQDSIMPEFRIRPPWIDEQNS